jgi:release factor glutamine methyltransferase
MVRCVDIRSVLNEAVLDLEHHGSETPRLDAEVLLAHCIQTNRIHLYAHPEQVLTEEELHHYQNLCARRHTGEPVAYITGWKEFWSLPFEVNPSVLIPRPETETLVETVLADFPVGECGHLAILEIGTGSGAISVALATELKGAHIVATDISPGALSVAIKNARNNGVEHQISFRLGSLFEPVSETFDIIISNPPYVAEEVFESLPIGIKEFEPRSALVADMGGTAFHRQILREGARHLKEHGRVFLEMGEDQEDRIAEMLDEMNLYEDVAFIRDYTGNTRAVKAKRKAEISIG